MTTPRKVLFTGLGTVGELVLDQFLRAPTAPRVLVACREPARTSLRVNLAALTAIQLGYEPDVRCVPLDLGDVARTAELIASFRPDVIFQCATLQSWWVIHQLPAPTAAALDESHVGPWLPLHLFLVYRLMQAVKESGVITTVVNTAYPDATHPILAARGLSPLTGIGNVANCIPPLRASVALILGVPVGRVSVRLVAQHYVSHRLPRHGNPGDAPLHFTCYVDGCDVTSDVDAAEVFRLLPGRLRRLGGRAGTAMTASSALMVLRALVDGEPRNLHAPGPNGLPGGYPVRIADHQVSLDLPHGLSLETAVAINREGLRFDGVEDIAPDGTVTFAQREMSIVADTIGYRCNRMSLDDVEACATDLSSAYRSFARRSVEAAA